MKFQHRKSSSEEISPLTLQSTLISAVGAAFMVILLLGDAAQGFSFRQQPASVPLVDYSSNSHPFEGEVSYLVKPENVLIEQLCAQKQLQHYFKTASLQDLDLSDRLVILCQRYLLENSNEKQKFIGGNRLLPSNAHDEFGPFRADLIPIPAEAIDEKAAANKRTYDYIRFGKRGPAVNLNKRPYEYIRFGKRSDPEKKSNYDYIRFG